MNRRGFLFGAMTAPAMAIPAAGSEGEVQGYVEFSMSGGSDALRAMVEDGVARGIAAYNARLPDLIRNIENNPRRR